MALFVTRGGYRPPQRRVVFVQPAERCPQQFCTHHTHGNVTLPMTFNGKSWLNGLSICHWRCPADHRHHVQMALIGGRWQRVRT